MPIPPPPPRQLAFAVFLVWLREWGAALCLSTVVLGAGAAVVLLLPSATAAPAAHPEIVEEQLVAEELALADLSVDGGPASLRIPAKPAPWQKPGPPCMRGEHAIRGACYQRYAREDMSPPCGPGIFEHEGQCWRAIRKPERKPSSVEE